MKLNWISLLFFNLTKLSSRSRQMLWQWLYNKMALSDASGKFIFMNYGYHEQADQNVLFLNNNDEPFRYFIQLYHHVVKDIDLQGKDVVEVGCGRGGGGSFLLRYKNPRSYLGVDLSGTAIKWCKQQFQFENAKWAQGLADALPVHDNHVDVVINVESSHCYPSMEKFLGEVRRVLRLGGYFAFCDLRHSSGIQELDMTIAASGLRIIKQTEITPQVLQALDKVSEARDAQITSIFPFFLRRAIRDFSAVKDTAVYNMLKTGEMKYFCYLLQNI